MKNYSKWPYLFMIILLINLFFNFQPTQAANLNLIINPSIEDSSGISPLNWQTDKWGIGNATFTYQTSGFNSGHSVYVKMTNYKKGDAKWYFDPVEVQPDSDYIFNDYYKSNATTSIVAMSLDASNIPTYYDVEPVVEISTSTEWGQETHIIHTLPNTKKLTVLHLLAKNGWLQTDNFSLIKNEQPAVVDFIPNNSVEIISPINNKLPEGWQKSKWGKNKAVFQYLNNGYEGTRSLKITMSNYNSGDAKWTTLPLTLENGKDFRFSVRYKTNTIPHAVVQYIKDDGSETYFGMQNPVPSGSDWQFYTDVFSVPQNVKGVAVFMFLSNNGWLQTDDYHITPYTYPAFDEGRVSLVFDDGFEQNITSVLPVIDKYNFKVTNCYATQYVEGLPKQEANVRKFSSSGHETCSHTVTHADLTTLTLPQIDYELTHSQNYLQTLVGQQVTSFATPLGAYNASVNAEIKKYYQGHRTADEGFNAKDNLDPYRLRVQNMVPSTTVEQFQQWVNKAKQDKTWLIVLYHAVGTSNLSEYDTYKANFDKEMAWLATSGISVERMDNALTEIKSQLP